MGDAYSGTDYWYGVRIVDREGRCGDKQKVSAVVRQGRGSWWSDYSVGIDTPDWHAVIGNRISPGQVFSITEPSGTSGTFWAYPAHCGGCTEATKSFRFGGGLLPNLSLERLRFPESPCAGLRREVKALVRETTGRCGGNFHLTWLDNRTEKMSVSRGGSAEIPLGFRVPKSPTDITVRLFDETRNEFVARDAASITPRAGSLDIGDFDIPKLRRAREFCPGEMLDGSILIEVLECAQEIKGKIFDTVSGNTFAEFGPEEYSPGDEIEPSFSLSMPRSLVSLKALVERRTDEGWKVVGSQTRDIGFREPRLEIGGIKI